MIIDEFARKTAEIQELLMNNDKCLLEENKQLKERISKQELNWKLVEGIGYGIIVSTIFINNLDN
ncbi:hypothetical protein [Companilactobacillus zhachilii]|uniref:Uncharacterized protein n=1 Tax=Companilactobacillus zhachilii TaxID=2304606 RepID=A0A386PRQ0_9LACO|nr:hypothetical protein [Companilactobacillus zhachilii]AYE38416.1 hypothetical protein D1B17_07105 [Companilactobacillus zhachilii]AYE38701.1 hypothetical protein D1B17_08690 [Companilactobacillus zhachilii]